MMITDNLSKYLAYVAFRRWPNADLITMKNQNGETITEGVFWEMYYSSNPQYEIAIGSGTTPPKKTDYKLENQIDAGVCILDMQRGMATASLTYKNTTSSDITVTEIGLISVGMTSDGPMTRGYWMLARELLENPVTVKAGEVKSFSITLDFNN